MTPEQPPGVGEPAQPPTPSRQGDAAAEPERSSEVSQQQLVVEHEGRVERVFTLSGQIVTIGRTPGNSLPLPHAAVSRLHAELRLTPDGLILTDMGSKNGTVVGRTQLTANQPVRLRPGSVIRIGPFTLRYEVVSGGPGATPAASPAEEQAANVRTPDAAPAPPPPAAYVMPTPARGTYPMPLPNGTGSIYLDHLPTIFQDSDFMGRFLQIFESVWEPLERRQDHLAMYIDPKTCPAPFLPWLAGWLGVEVGARWPEGRLRTLVEEAVELYRWRGTQYGLTRMIEVCTGVTPVIAETASNPFVLHIRVAIAPDSDVDRELLERLIVANKPAHAAYLLEVFD